MVNFWPQRPIDSVLVAPGGRLILGGPIYKLQEVQNLCKAIDSIRLFNDDCINDVQHTLKWDMADVQAAVSSLTHANYRKSFWCDTTNKVWLCADDYVVRNYDDGLGIRAPFKLYLKFAVNNKGVSLLMLSCHDSDD